MTSDSYEGTVTTGLREHLHELQLRLNVATDAILGCSRAISAWCARLPILKNEESADWERQYDALQQEYDKIQAHAESLSAEFSAVLAAYKEECGTDFFPSE